MPLAKALTLLHQLLGFFTSRASFLSYSVASPINLRISSFSMIIVYNIIILMVASLCSQLKILKT